MKFAGVGPRMYVGMPLPLSRKGAVARRAGHPLFQRHCVANNGNYIIH